MSSWFKCPLCKKGNSLFVGNKFLNQLIHVNPFFIFSISGILIAPQCDSSDNEQGDYL